MKETSIITVQKILPVFICIFLFMDNEQEEMESAGLPFNLLQLVLLDIVIEVNFLIQNGEVLAKR